MVQALGLSFTVATLALAVRLQASAQFGWWSASVAWSVCGALAAAFAGLKLGEVLRGRLAGPTFQKALFLVFIALGAANLIWPDDGGMNDAANMQPAAARLKWGCRGHRLREIGTCPR